MTAVRIAFRILQGKESIRVNKKRLSRKTQAYTHVHTQDTYLLVMVRVTDTRVRPNCHYQVYDLVLRADQGVLSRQRTQVALADFEYARFVLAAPFPYTYCLVSTQRCLGGEIEPVEANAASHSLWSNKDRKKYRLIKKILRKYHDVVVS